MEKFLTLTVSGAISGAIFSLIAAGLVLSYSATGIFNFSYGAIAFTSAFLYYQLNSGLHWPIVPAAAFVILVFAPLLGLLLDVAVFRPLARATESAKIMATVGLLIAIPALTTWINDQLVNTIGFTIPRSGDVTQVGLPPSIGPSPKVDWKLPNGIPFDSNQLVVFISAVVVAVALWVLMRHTPLGLRMRAVVDRPTLASTRGINERTTSRYAWVIGTMLAALAGVVGAPIIGSLLPAGFITVMFVATAAAVLGGLRSIPLAFVGGLLLGIAENLVVGYVSIAKTISGFNSAVPFVLLLLGLVVMARERSRRGGSTADETPPPDYLADLPWWRRALPWAIAVAFLIVYILFLANDFWVGVMASGLTLSLIFLSFVVVTGMGGMVSLAQGTFVLVSALTTGLLMNRYEWAMLPAILVGVGVAVLLGVIVALPALRLGGLPFALATLALAFLGDQVLFQWDFLRNMQSGWAIPRPVIGPFDMNNNKTFAMFLLLLVGLVALLIRNLRRSSWGRAIAATRSSEIAANTSGVSVLRVKLGVFAISAAIAGIGGVFFASYQFNISNSSVVVTTGLLWLATVVLFGIRRPAAAVLAGIVSAASPVIFNSGFHISFADFLSWNGTTSSEIPAILFGLGAVQLARYPDGVISYSAAQNYARRMKRKAKRAAELHVPVSEIAAVVQAEDAAIVAATERERRELVTAGVVQAEAAVTEARGAGTPPVLVVHGLRAGYDDVEVLHGIELALHGGEITALLGVNGSGKTTLCSTISGVVPVRAGTITMEGADASAWPAYRRARAGVLVAPESRGVFPGLTVDENLVLRLSTVAARDEVYERFPQLSERRDLAAGSLSGGEQQMLALAPVLVSPPPVVVADEPTLGLAPRVVAEVMQVFVELRDRGTAILLVEEKARDVLEIADEVAFLDLGHIVWAGPRRDIDDERLVATYLGASRS
ncbi:MAG TPA: ATP-binding cassette domain-containing protein [Acidimicrobiia bacterium]|nr:ATP-binding cassette domain-containing protein [Acidimicrobiia bacterium]